MSNVSMEKLHHRPKKTRRVRPQAFYPCPPPTAAEMDKDDSSDEDDPFGYIDTLVSHTIFMCMWNEYFA